MNYYFHILITIFLVFSTVSCRNSKPKKFDLTYSKFEEKLNHDDFSELVEIISNNQLSTENYLDWSFNFQTRNADGYAKFRNFERAIYVRANSDEKFLEKVAVFYSKWPRQALLAMKGDKPHSGAVKIAEYALRLQGP